MDHILTARIGNFLQLKNPTYEQIIEGATLLLKCNPARERAIYNTAIKRPKTALPWIRADLKKYYNIRKRGLSASEVEKYNKETLTQVDETLSVIPATVKKEDGAEYVPLIPELGVRGKRKDHDKLPPEIQAIWERNAERYKQMRKLRAQLAQMIAKPNYAPCDGNELCYQLRTLDTEQRNDYQTYDTFVVETKKKSTVSAADPVDAFTDNMKVIQNARTTVSRGINRKTAHTDASLKKLQDAVNTLIALKQTLKDETVKKLVSLGVAVPNVSANA